MTYSESALRLQCDQTPFAAHWARAALGNPLERAGIVLRDPASNGDESQQFRARLRLLGLAPHVEIAEIGYGTRFRLRPQSAGPLTPDCDTTGLCQRLDLGARNAENLEREILLAMLASPVAFEFPSGGELISSLCIRNNIVAAARKTALAFHTSEAERPADYWDYDEDAGFTIKKGESLITALAKATQPDETGKRYSFSCYRASEYVILLGIARELEICNPQLLVALQRRWETKAIRSGLFHEVFLREYGTMGSPLPPGYYVPGDRVWFRNPDEPSSDVPGYEGSWVIYLGGGLFSNFWQPGKPYTLTAKCLEIYHWRHATFRDRDGVLRIDEAEVARRVARSHGNPAEVERILGIMMRYRDPQGVYRDGGCIDTSREHPRWVRPASSDMIVP